MAIQSRIIALLGALALLFALILWLLASPRPDRFAPSHPATQRTGYCDGADCSAIAKPCYDGSHSCEGYVRSAATGKPAVSPPETPVKPPATIIRSDVLSLRDYLMLILMLTVSIAVSVILAVRIALRFIQDIRLDPIVVRVVTSPGAEAASPAITVSSSPQPLPRMPLAPMMGMLWPLLIFVGLLLVALLYIALERLL
jgi:hypothetical protein